MDFEERMQSSNKGSDTKQPAKDIDIFDQTIEESVYVYNDKKSEESEPKLHNLMENFDA